jgi:uncharacterized protein (TIGR03435 family)
MKRLIPATCVLSLLSAQSPDSPPKFEIADVHVSPKSSMQFVRSTPPRNGRYEIRNATMVDLIRAAYEFDADKVIGGPSWLEWDRFDVVAKIPKGANMETIRPMLRALLEERFKLVTHKDTRPMPTYALVVGKKPQLKQAEGTEDTGCRPQDHAGSSEGIIRLSTMGPGGGAPTTITLAPGGIIQYACRNMTMAAFASSGLRGLMGAFNFIGNNPVRDETGLKGAWNFDIRFSMGLVGPPMQNAERITLAEAIEKQLGLKLEEHQVPTPVIVVDSASQKPSDNPPGVAEALPNVAAPVEFDVATVKPSDPNARGSNFRTQQGGGFQATNMNLSFLVGRAFNENNRDALIGLPAWADTERFDINAKAPSMEGGSGAPSDPESMAPMIRALLVERFKLKYHTEERPMTAYTLVAAKSKMKKADPNSRTFCKNANAPAGAPPGSRVLNCQNVTMVQFAERLHNLTRELSFPVLDATGLEGGWDLSITFSNMPMMMGMAMPVRIGGGDGPGPGGGGAGGAVGAAPDPTGGYTIFAAIEKQLGLKLEAQKRNVPVYVIDHIEQHPTEN